MPITIQQLQSDPTFLSLPDAEKLKGLGEVLPGFSDLPTGEQQKALADFRGKGKLPSAPPPSPKSIGAEFNPDMYPMDLPAAKVGLSMLPALGGMGGAALGTATIANPYIGAIGGAGVGSSVEQFIKSKLPGGGEVPTEERVKDVMGNMALSPIGVGAGKVANPALSMTDDAARAVEFAAEHSLPIKLSEVSPSFATQFLDELSTIGFAGRYAELKWAKKANLFLSDARNVVLGKLTGVKDLNKIPVDALPGKIKPSLEKATEGKYEDILGLVNLEKEAAGKGWEASRYGSDIPIDLTGMRRAAGELMRDPVVQNAKMNKAKGVKDTPVEWLRKFLDKSDKGLSFTDLNKLQGEMNKTLYGAADANTKMWASFADDLSAWDGTIGAMLNDKYAIARKTAQMSMRGGVFDTVYGVLRGATKVDPKTKAEILDGAALYARLKSPAKGYGAKTPEAKIIEMMGEEKGRPIVQGFEDLANYALYSQGLRSETGKLFNINTVVGSGVTGAGGYAGGIAGVLVPQGTSLALTVLMSAPKWKGGLRNFLLQGVKPSVRLGVQGAVQGAGSAMLDPGDPTQGGAIPLR